MYALFELRIVIYKKENVILLDNGHRCWARQVKPHTQLSQKYLERTMSHGNNINTSDLSVTLKQPRLKEKITSQDFSEIVQKLTEMD